MDRFSGSVVFNAFSAINSTVLAQSVTSATFTKLSFQGGVSAIGGAFSPYTWSVTNIAGGRYDIDGQGTSAQPIAIVLATLIKELQNKGILR